MWLETQREEVRTNMKRIFAGALAALLSFSAMAATLTPIQLLQPAGSTSGQFITSTGPTTAPAWTTVTLSGLGGLAKASNLSDLASVSTARTNLGLGTSATVNTGTSGATVPLLSTANTWTLAQSFTVRPTFNSNTPVDSGNVLTAVPGRLLNVQVFSASGTYTPTAGATKAIVKVMSAGGGSGGNPATSTAQTSMSGPGNAGAYGEIWIASGLASQTVTIGAVGAAGAVTPTAGGTGGTTSFGALISCTGGAGGAAGAAVTNATSFTIYPSATAATCSGSGTFLVSGTGASAEKGFDVTGQVELPGNGASTMWGQGGQGRTTSPSAGTGYGAGAGAFYLNASTAAAAGASGAPAIVIVEEFN